MVTQAQFHAMLKPLVARRSDLAFGKGCLVLQPVTHYLRFVTINGSRWDKESFRPVYGVNQLFDRLEHLIIPVAAEYSHPAQTFWNRTRDGEAELFVEHVEQHILPLLEPVTDPAHHLAFAREHTDCPAPGGLPPGSLVRDHCFAGRYDAAQKELEDWFADDDDYFSWAIDLAEKERANPRRTRRGEPYFPERTWIPRLGEQLPREAKDDLFWFWRDAYLLQLLRTDRSSIIPLLHEWEEYSVRAMKLEKYWHRTPFPAESVSSF